MHETTGTLPAVETEEKSEVKVEKKERKEVDISTLTSNQRSLLRGGLKNSIMEENAFNALGGQQKTIFYDTCDMFTKSHKGINAIQFLDLSGEEYWKKVDMNENGKTKKEDCRFIKFKFDFVIPGTSQKLSVIKEWKYEDFTP